MASYCHVCGSELAAESNSCDYCGVAVDTSLNSSTAPKKQVSQSWNQKTQARFLSVLAFTLAVAVLGVYLFRNTQASIPAAPSPSLSDNLENIEGDWIGTVHANSGEIYEYELILNQTGSEISGFATTSNEIGGADAQIRGTYYNGILSLEESGGTEIGDWANEEMCYWELDLALAWGEGQAQLIGSYEGIACDSSGTISLVRAD